MISSEFFDSDIVSKKLIHNIRGEDPLEDSKLLKYANET